MKKFRQTLSIIMSLTMLVSVLFGMNITTIQAEENKIEYTEGNITIYKYSTWDYYIVQGTYYGRCYLLPVGGSTRLPAPTPPYSRDYYITNESWSTSNSSAVRCSGSTITAVGDGEATIRASVSWYWSSPTVYGQTDSGTATDSWKIYAASPLKSVKLSKSSVTLQPGKTASVAVTSTSPDSVYSRALSGKITFKSTKTSVAKVTSGGKITAVAPGSASINAVAKDGTVLGKCSVTVKDIKAKSVKLKKSSLTLISGDTASLAYTASPSNATEKPKFSSSNKKVATVDSKGKITAKGAGTATIKAKVSSGSTASCKVTVKKKSTKIDIKKSSLTMKKGTSQKLSYTLSPKGSGAHIKWSSSNTKVATVDSKGKVTAKGGGTATITAKVSSKVLDTCKISVPVKAKSIAFSKSKVVCPLGDKMKLACKPTPSDATEKITYTTSNKKVATVDSKGNITAKSIGTATIKAKVPSGATASCKVTVKKKATKIDITKSSVVIKKGKSQTLSYTLSPKDSVASKVTWSSSNTKVATVDSKGKVTAKSAGNATITAKVSSKVLDTCKVKVEVPAEVVTLYTPKEFKYLAVGDKYKLACAVQPKDANDITFSSSNTQVATVDSTGTVSGKSKGTVTITAKTSTGITSKCTISVLSSPNESVALGDCDSAYVDDCGDLYMWGYNEYGQLGDGTKTDKYTPVKIMSNVKAVSLGYYHSAAITANGDLYTWGANGNTYAWGYYGDGRLGDGTTTNRSTPVKIMSNVKAVSLGYYHSAAITTNGDLYMWGHNSIGQLGDGTSTDKYTPVKIMSNVKAVSLGSYHSAAITANGDLYMWGDNDEGQLGDGTSTDKYTPVKIMSNVKAVSLGYYHSAAITANGDLYTWGDNRNGQLGDGTSTDKYTPVKIMSNVKAVSLGTWYSAAITTNGDLYMWGWNSCGLGVGTTTCKYTPIKIMSNVKAVSLGGFHSAAITENGALFTWGYNGHGQLGDGTTTERHSPTLIN